MRILGTLTRLFAGNWLWMLIVLGIFAGGGVIGYQKGYQKGYSEVLVLQHQFDEYRIEVLKSVSEGNSKTLSAVSDLQKNLFQLSKEFEKDRRLSQEFSNNLIKELQTYEGPSCPLSPAVKHYLDGVRLQQSDARARNN